MLIRSDSMDQTQIHFQQMVWLMMIFFFTDVILETINGVGFFKAGSLDGIMRTAHDAFLSFFGIAAGMFHGMLPQQNAVTSQSTQTAQPTASQG